MAKKEKSKGLSLLPTANDLPKTTREEVIAILNERLADATDLRSQVKHAHWNVKGPNFIALHELFDDIVDHLDEQADDLAERAVQLGGIAPGTVRSAAAASQIAEYPADIQDGNDHLKALVVRVAAYAALIRAAIEIAGQAGDAATSDLFTGIARAVDKDLWFLEAHLG
jgi:starvation-inducible DNA-binding protein